MVFKNLSVPDNKKCSLTSGVGTLGGVSVMSLFLSYALLGLLLLSLVILYSVYLRGDLTSPYFSSIISITWFRMAFG